MTTDLNVIIIDSGSTFPEKLTANLKKLGYKRILTIKQDSPIDHLAALKPDLVFIGPSLDSFNCEKSIHKLTIINPSISILSSSEEWNAIEIANSCFEGVYHLSSEPSEDEIRQSIEKVLLNKEERIDLSGCPVFIGQSSAIKNIRAKIRKVADTSITVLITGETGTGKELIARSIHFLSPRNRGPLVKVDCASLPDELLESEVFGFQK